MMLNGIPKTDWSKFLGACLTVKKELANYCVEMRLFGLSVRDLRSVAFHLAEKNHLDHGFHSEKQLAGKDLVAGFLR